MSRKHLHTPTGVSLISMLFAACGHESAVAPDAVAVAFAIQAGDDQLFFPNARLPERLSARLEDESGRSVARSGLRVHWQVVAGDGSVVPVDDTTSALGNASADVILGSNLGSVLVRLTADNIAAVEFSARATLPGPIVFVSNRRTRIVGNETEGYPGDLYVMKEDGTEVIGLFRPNFGIQSLFDPAWSPDGAKILYARAIGRPAGGTPGLFPIGLFVIHSDGGGEIQVPAAALPSYVRYFAHPDWSPSGDRIVATLAAEGVGNISTEATPGALYVMSRTGIGPQPLSGISGTARAPSWDATTGRLAFECENGPTTAICVADENGNGVEVLTEGLVPDTDPAWSPDGLHLLFARDTLSGGGIWRINEDGTGLERVIEGHAISPSWSPDGTRFVYERNVDGRIDIWLFDFVDASSMNLTNGASRDSEPAWRR